MHSDKPTDAEQMAFHVVVLQLGGGGSKAVTVENDDDVEVASVM